MKKKIIIPIIILIIVIGVILYVINNNKNVLLKAYLKENNGNYTLIIKGPNSFTPSDAWIVLKNESKDNVHYERMPWINDKTKNITKVVIEDEIKPISTGFWFVGFENLKEIEGIDKINTSNVENMAAMFSGCKTLEEIDLSSFDTSKVKSVAGMFNGCEKLKTIYVSNKWNVDNVEYSENMFNKCLNLVGQNETKYDEYITDKTFAQIDNLDTAGYLSTKNEQ